MTLRKENETLMFSEALLVKNCCQKITFQLFREICRLAVAAEHCLGRQTAVKPRFGFDCRTHKYLARMSTVERTPRCSKFAFNHSSAQSRPTSRKWVR